MADPFIGRFREFEGGLTVEGPLHQVFPLFSPEGERAWVPGWDPELLHPRDTPWAEGQIFRTREERGEAIWIVTRLQRSDYRVEYHRVEPGRYVARVRVACADAGAGVTVVLTSYAFLGLSERAERRKRRRQLQLVDDGERLTAGDGDVRLVTVTMAAELRAL